MISSHPDKDNPPGGAVASSADKATTQPKKEAPGKKREHRSPSALEDTTGGVMEDTERKGAEERIRFQARMLDAVGQSVIAIDPQGKVLYWNRGAEELYGWSAEAAMGRPIVKVISSDELVEQAEEIMAELMAGRSWSGEFEVRRKDGTTFPAMVTNTPLHDEQGNLVTIIGVSTDITDIKKTEELRSSEERFRSLVQNSADVITVADSDGTILYDSPAVERVLGYKPEERVGTNTFEYLGPSELERATSMLEEVLASPGARLTGEMWWPHKDGSFRYLEVTPTNLLEDPAVRGIVVNWRDITERKEAEEMLRESEERFRTVFEDSPIGVALVDLDGRRFRANRSLCEMLDCPEEDLLGENYLEHVHPDDRQISTEYFQRALGDAERAGTYELERRYLRADRHVVWNLTSVSLIRDSKGNPSYFVCLHQDITDRKDAEKRLQYQATHDLLTDLPNRHLFMDRLKRALRLTRRRKGRKVAVLYLDLDNFKVVNDSLGHEAGDLLLVAAGERLRWCLRPEDSMARFGGDEFAVLLEEVQAPSDAAKVAERIVERFRDPFVVEGREFVIRPSIGIALGTARQKTAEEILRDADTAMYQVKGREDYYQVFDPVMYEQALRRLKLESDLRRAIEDEEFVVCYQPIIDLQTEEMWGVEALVRWENPEQQGLLAPSQFIPIAEESGLVVPMGRWVLEQACRQGVRWQQGYPHVPPLVMSVNLSARQLQHPDVAEMVEEGLKRTGFDARYLSLDITETLYINALAGNTAALDKLKKMGVGISIDDFGTGYSSLAYLKRLPAETLKIDRSFIKGVGEDAEDTAIVRMIIELAHTLGMEVIAEGVESEEQVEQLKEMGCDRGQGYYFAKPLPPEEASDFSVR